MRLGVAAPALLPLAIPTCRPGGQALWQVLPRPPLAPNFDSPYRYLAALAGAICAASTTELPTIDSTRFGSIGMARLPTAEDLKGLPLRAIVALGARCALRVRPLYWGGRQDATALDKTIHAAEKFLGSSKRTVWGKPHVHAVVDAIPDVAQRRAVDTVRHVVLSYTAATLGELDDAVQGSLNAVTAAANAAAAYAARRTVPAPTADAARATQDGSARVVAAAASDFERLLKLSEERGHPSGEMGDPVEISGDGPLGPLWPDGLPEDWPG